VEPISEFTDGIGVALSGLLQIPTEPGLRLLATYLGAPHLLPFPVLPRLRPPRHTLPSLPLP